MLRKRLLFGRRNWAGNALSGSVSIFSKVIGAARLLSHFIANAVEWLNPANARGGQLLVKQAMRFGWL